METGGRLDSPGEPRDGPRGPDGVARRGDFGGSLPSIPFRGAIENPTVGVPGRIPENLARTGLSILLPALNEERGVVEVMNRIPRTTLTKSGFHSSVYLLDGGSTDRTRHVAAELGAKVVVQTGVGKGSAFREFIPGIKEELIVFMDSDGTYSPELIPAFVEKLRQGNPVVLGSRIRGSIDDGAMSKFNYLGNRVLSSFASILFGIPVSDVCTGMWAFASSHLKSLDLTAQGFDLEAEIFAECALKHIPIVEVPIPYGKRLGQTKLRARVGLQIALALLKKRLRPGSRNGDVVSSGEWVPPVSGQGRGS